MSGGETFNSSAINNEIDNSITFERILLSEVRKAKSLYCSNDPDYNNLAKNRLIWLMIAEKCKKTVPECVKTWHSLLRIYFSSSSEISWVHNIDFLKFEPYLSNHKLQTPSKVQRNELLKGLWCNSYDLHKPESTSEDRKKIWLKVISNCNEITPGVIMSNLNWQKYWLLVKQTFGVRLYSDRTKKYVKNSNVAQKFTEEEIKIIEICRGSLWDSISNVIAALGKNTEISEEKLIIRCKKCLMQRDEILYLGYCSKCYEKPLFCSLCDAGGAEVKYNLTEWSKQALDLLPSELASAQQICVCTNCSDELKAKATYKWRICRACESNRPTSLESLFSCNYKLRKGFKDSTKIDFNEKDGLPGYICKICKTQINRLNDFVAKFMRTQNRLMQIHAKNFIGSLEDQIKQNDINKPALTAGGGIKAYPKSGVVKIHPNNNVVVPTKIIPARTSESKQLVDTPNPVNLPDPPEISFKNNFAMQRSNQQKTNQPSITVAPVTQPQPGKIFSNRITITPRPPSKPLQLIPKLNNSLQTGKGITIYPSKISVNTKITQPPVLIARKPQEQIVALKKRLPNTTINLKQTTTSKPAIFTIPKETPYLSEPVTSRATHDYETIEDAPPVFCIPKPVNKSVNSSSDADKQLMDFNPIPSAVIKIEETDDETNDDDIDCKEIRTTNTYPFVELTAKPAENNNPKESSASKPTNNTGVVPSKDLTTLPSSTSAAGPFVSVAHNAEQQLFGTGSPSRMRPTIVQKSNIHIAKPINIVQKSKLNAATKPEGEQPGIKKPRKYWGTVNEFQVSPLTSKAQHVISLNRAQLPNETQKITLPNKNVGFSSLSEESSIIHIPLNMPIKEEYTNTSPSENRIIKSSFKVKKLRVDIKRDKRVRGLMSSKSKKLCLMQSIKDNVPDFRPHGMTLTYESPRQIASRNKLHQYHQ